MSGTNTKKIEVRKGMWIELPAGLSKEQIAERVAKYNTTIDQKPYIYNPSINKR